MEQQMRDPLVSDAINIRRAFIAYVKSNALLHDADKATAEFLKWSLKDPKERREHAEDGYPGHDTAYGERRSILEGKPDLFPLDLTLDIPFPAPRVACEPHKLRTELYMDLLWDKGKNADHSFIERVEQYNKSGSDNTFKKLPKKLREIGKNDKDVNLDTKYAEIFELEPFKDLKEEVARQHHRWLFDSRPGRSLFDFFLWHHHIPPSSIKTSEVPTSLQVFTAGTAGCDGIDTKYETEAEALSTNRTQHHNPIVGDDRFLIATPFGYERETDLVAAENACMGVPFKECLQRVAEGIMSKSDFFAPLVVLEKLIPRLFDQSIIRTGRPMNDITLADHSLSTASLAIAQAARVVLETAGIQSGSESPPYYATPMRKKLRPEDSQWPISEYALFSCAVNAGSLDNMALELKDITAIRQQVEVLLDKFIEVFSSKTPVGGFVYRDQHGAHLVVPVLGDPTRRWIQGNAPHDINFEGDMDIPWMNMPSGAGETLTDQDFREWLFDVAKSELKDRPDICFGRELLIGLRYTKIGDELNRLAEAIQWSRSISQLGTGAPATGHGEYITTFNFEGSGDESKAEADICPVCRIRFPDKPRNQELKSPQRKKCEICRNRVGKEKTPPEEEGNLEVMAKKSGNRVALVSLSFNLDKWLAEGSNSGIFCYGKNQEAPYPRIPKHQRLNSFGRLRRIWRSTENFLLGVRDGAQAICGGEGFENNPFLMRTILSAPQDLQVIVPADRVRAILDQTVDRFFEEFGRVPGRVPFHISVLVFAYRVPIYLVIEAARRLKGMALSTETYPVGIQRQTDENFIVQRLLSGRLFVSYLEIPFKQKYQPDTCTMGGEDRFHVNLESMGGTADETWQFAGAWTHDRPQNALMVLNRICLAEIKSGLALNELALSSENLPCFCCHDIPLEYWYGMKCLMGIESSISGTKKRSLRSILTRRERLWDLGDPYADEIKRDACEMLWKEPGRVGAKRWERHLNPSERNLLVDVCLNGAVHLAQFVEECLEPPKVKERQYDGTCKL